MNRRDYRAFNQAVAELKTGINMDENLKRQLLETDKDKILNVLLESGLNDLNMSKGQKVEFYKSLIGLLLQAIKDKDQLDLDADLSLKDLMELIQSEREF